MDSFFATCPRGLEPLLIEDVLAVGAKSAGAVPGGVHFQGTWETCYAANLHSRIATRILWRINRAPYANEEDIYRLARETPWPAQFDQSKSIRVDVTAIKSPLKSLEFITLRIKDAVCDAFRAHCGKRPNVDTREPDVRIHGFLSDAECTLYLDTSGLPLYQRGLRQKTVDAPLKENLAAGILRLTGWTPGVPLLDPMCGSGTFLLEAAEIAMNRAPGARRNFGFEQLKKFKRTDWTKQLEAAKSAEKNESTSHISGSDNSAQAVRAALANLDRAELLPAVNLKLADLLDIEAPAESGILIANPPYGDRLSEQEELAEFYPALGSALKRHFAGWSCWLLTADTRMPKLMRLTPSRKIPLYNGALECRLYEFKMVAGSNRK